jgi:aspartate racemase
VVDQSPQDAEVKCVGVSLMVQNSGNANLSMQGTRPAFPMENICHHTIGVLGGMGSYATLHLFRKLIDAFPSEKEWERPRIIVDNNCVMPSRVRAILYGERRQELVTALVDSLRRLLSYKVDILVLACNTSHCFLPEIRKQVSLSDDVLVDLIATVRDRCCALRLSDIYVIATEGTIAARVYEQYCQEYGIAVRYPDACEQRTVRGFIEGVKRSQWDGLADRFVDYLTHLDCDNIILGCTELSVLYDRLTWPTRNAKKVIDPVEAVVESIRARILDTRPDKAAAG